MAQDSPLGFLFIGMPSLGLMAIIGQLVAQRAVRLADRRHTTESIGDGLVRIGALAPEQVGEVLRRQELGDNRPFGWIAVRLG